MELEISVRNMNCKSCETLIRDALEEKGAKGYADSKKGIVKVVFDENKLTIEKVKKIISDSGFEVE